eukprot:2370601-Rhodomonas_salina.5
MSGPDVCPGVLLCSGVLLPVFEGASERPPQRRDGSVPAKLLRMSGMVLRAAGTDSQYAATRFPCGTAILRLVLETRRREALHVRAEFKGEKAHAPYCLNRQFEFSQLISDCRGFNHLSSRHVPSQRC